MKPATSAIGTENADEWHRLRALLLGAEQASLHTLTAKVGDSASLARSVAGVLPNAVAIRALTDDRLTVELAPLVEASLHQSVKKNPQPLVDALYPLMGPAIRRSISEALVDMTQAFNRALEQTFSPRALKWRFDAWRSGQSYASVVLLKSLVYRVEQVLLIHRKTGLLLSHAQAENIVVQDPDMVSGMLTAIRDFASDSFQVGQDDSVDTIRLSDLSVQVRVGPKAILAAVIRGNAPETLRTQLSKTLEEIHQRFGLALAQFDGDAGRFAHAENVLGTCLLAQTRSQEIRPWRAYAILALMLALAGWLSWARHQSVARWDTVLSALEHEPGFVVLEASQTARGTVHGLRDPLARAPRDVIGGKFDESAIIWDLRPYLSLEPALVLARARQFLNPPSSLTLSLNGEILRASGTAPTSWFVEARDRAAFIPGIRRFDDGSALQTRQQTLSRIRALLTATTLYFEPGMYTLSQSEHDKLQNVLPTFTELRDTADNVHMDYRIEIVGRADAPGTTATNLQLSLARADTIRQYLIAHGVPSDRLHALGVGAIEATRAVATPNEDLERRVNFRIGVEPSNGTTAPAP
jgi:outer membrane protein OmpA-like peptidoglycan-associated protein